MEYKPNQAYLISYNFDDEDDETDHRLSYVVYYDPETDLGKAIEKYNETESLDDYKEMNYLLDQKFDLLDDNIVFYFNSKDTTIENQADLIMSLTDEGYVVEAVEDIIEESEEM